MNEPPSSLLPLAADPSLPPIEILFPPGPMAAGLLLFALSALCKAGARLIERRAAGGDALPPAIAAAPDRARLATRTLQYLALVGGTAAWLAPGADAPAWRPWVAAVLGYLVYLGLVALAQSYGASKPRFVLRLLLPIARSWGALAAPLVSAAVRVDGVLRERLPEDEPPPDPRERAGLLLEGAGLEPDELAMLRNVLEFRDRTAGELMVPRPDVTWVSTTERLEDALERVHGSGHSRVPLCEESPDRVVGYLHARDLAFARSAGDVGPSALARPVAFVPEGARAASVLRRFQAERAHMGVVVDEFGGMAGLITLEDLLEELVGEIRDEFDVEEVEIRTLANGDVLVDGAVRLDELEESLQLEFGEVEEETIGGFIFGRLAREVAYGDEVDVPGGRLRVEGVEGLRVTLVRVLRDAARSAAGAPAGQAEARAELV